MLSGVGAILKTHSPEQDTLGFSRVTWKASAEFDVTDHNLLYATVETGYRAGGLQMSESRTRYSPSSLPPSPSDPRTASSTIGCS